MNTPTLTINLDALADNWRLCQSRFSGKECASVVKSNAYGLGVKRVAGTLANAGCHTFFVATLAEAIALRDYLPKRTIAVFHGIQAGEAPLFIEHGLVPVLNTVEQVHEWRMIAEGNPGAPSMLHIDTGMRRLGITPGEWDALLARDASILRKCNVSLVMSHFACASEPNHTANAWQRDAFAAIAKQCGDIPTSLCNSAGVLLGEDYHFDVARPGCALYGISPFHASSNNPMKPVITLSAPIVQLRMLEQEEGVGYGHTSRAPKGTRIATIALGYADGLDRGLSNRLTGFIEGHEVKQIGRVSMDLTSFDVSNVPPSLLQHASRIEILNDTQTVDHLAEQLDTIGYEICTNLGSRIARRYVSSNGDAE